MRGEPPIRHDVVKEYLSHRVSREALPPVIGLIPQIHSAVTRLHLDFSARLKPQTRIPPISVKVNRHAYLAAAPILMPHHGVSVKVHARVAVSGHKPAGSDRLDPRSQLEQQGVCQRRIRYACGSWYVVVSKTFPSPLLEQERLVDDPSERWLEQALGGEVAFFTQFRIHGYVVEPNAAVDKERSRSMSCLAACQLTDDAA
jgi:hypothetical protein